MKTKVALLVGALVLDCVAYSQPQITTAPVPVVRRQDHIENIEIHTDYAASIGVDTQYLTLEGTSTKWIGVNKEYLTEETKTVTVDNAPSTTVVKAQLAVVTATAAAEAVAVGDVTVLLHETVQSQLESLVSEAATACAIAAKKLLRRQDVSSALACIVQFTQGKAQAEDVLRLLDPAEWNTFNLALHPAAQEIVAAAFQVLKTQAQRNKFLLIFAGITATGLLAHESNSPPENKVPYKLHFSGGTAGGPKDNKGEPTEDDDEESSTSSTCNPSATPDENSPACDDNDCQGKEKVCQAEGTHKNCPCVLWTKYMRQDEIDMDWLAEQQKIFQELDGSMPDTVPPQCTSYDSERLFDGRPFLEPTAYCWCTSANPDGQPGVTSGKYAPMTEEGKGGCDFPTMPTSTIQLTTNSPAGGEVTSCRIESSGIDELPYCTCNDDGSRPLITTKYQGTEVTVCPDATATMTADGTPTDGALCYPTLGSPYTNPDLDQVMRLCNAGKDDLSHACMNLDGIRPLDVACPGRSADKDVTHGVWTNTFPAWFEKAPDAPADCDYLLASNRASDDVKRPFAENLCVPALETIREKCPWNGGEVKNKCGTFKYQSCRSDKTCKGAGSPQGEDLQLSA